MNQINVTPHNIYLYEVTFKLKAYLL